MLAIPLGAAAQEPALDEEFAPPVFAAPELAVPANCRSSLWLIDTRAGADCNRPRALRYFLGDGSGNWAPLGQAEFQISTPPGVPTVVFIHGNRYAESDAIHVGQAVFSRLVREVGDGRPLRFVIWSWPSERIVGTRRDVREKALRAEEEGQLVAPFLTDVVGEVPVCLLGHSYGARVIGTALHQVALSEGATSEIAEQDLEYLPRPRRAVLMAGALDCHWLAPGGAYGAAFGAVEHAVVMYNPGDPALKWYPRLWCRGGPEALGYVGLPAHTLAHFVGRIDQVNVEPLVEHRHRFTEYLVEAEIWAMIRAEAMFEPLRH